MFFITCLDLTFGYTFVLFIVVCGLVMENDTSEGYETRSKVNKQSMTVNIC